MRPTTATGLLTFLAAALVGCAGTESPPPRDDEVSLSPEYIFETLSSGGAAFVTYASNLQDYLPNQRVSVQGAEPRRGAAGVVIGDIVSAEVTYAGKILEPDEEGNEEKTAEVDPASNEADWRMMTATVEIDRLWVSDPTIAGRTSVTFPINPSEDPDAFSRGLVALGRVIAVLTREDRSTPSAYRIGLADAALGVVDSDGVIQFPALEAGEESRLLDGIETVEDIERAARAEQAVIEIGPEGFPVSR